MTVFRHCVFMATLLNTILLCLKYILGLCKHNGVIFFFRWPFCVWTSRYYVTSL